MQTELTTYHHQLADLFGNISIQTLMVTSMTIFLILTLIFVIMTRWEWQSQRVKKEKQKLNPNTDNQKPEQKKRILCTMIQIILATGIICSAFVTIVMLQTQVIAQKHGMYQTHMPYASVLTGIEHTPEESTLPKDQTQLANSLIIYYKFGCEDCEAVYFDLQESLPDNANIYWVSTRSEQGQELRKTYPVSNVPTIAYITDRNTAVTSEITNKYGEKVTLNQEKLQEILDLYFAAN